MCVECAESLRALEPLAKRYTIPEIDLQRRWIGDPYVDVRIGQRVERKSLFRNLAYVATFGKLVILLRAQVGGSPIRFKVGEEEREHTASNVLDAWGQVQKIVFEFRSPGSRF